MIMLRTGGLQVPAASQEVTARVHVDTAPAQFHSAIYAGTVRHRRHTPHAHAFTYGLFMMYVDLAEIERLFRGRWLWSVGRWNVAQFRRSDYLGDPGVPLEQAVRDQVERRTGHRPLGPIRLLTHLRYFGHCFNPVSFYYCFEPDGHTLQAIVAEITNTPCKQRHSYVLTVSQAEERGDVHAWQFEKRFHVSPFMAMEHRYAWRFTAPAQELRVQMDVLPTQSPSAATGEQRALDVTLVLRRREVTAANLSHVLVRYPLMTLRVVLAIHWQALLLWLKRNPVHDHPDTKVPSK